MRLAFLIYRKNYYRLLAPAVDAALGRGWDVECCHDWSHPRRGGKASEFPDAAPAFRNGAPRVRTHMGAADLAAQWRAEPPDAVIALDPPAAEVRAASRARFVWLQYSTDIVCYPTARGLLDREGAAEALRLNGFRTLLRVHLAQMAKRRVDHHLAVLRQRFQRSIGVTQLL